MRFTCNREGLLIAVQFAATVVPSRTTKPILQNIKLDITGGGDSTEAILSATDLEQGLRYFLTGVVADSPGSMLLPSGRFLEILRTVSEEEIRVEETDAGVRIKTANSVFEMPGEDPDQFPPVPDLGSGESHTIKAGHLALMSKRTVYAAEQNELSSPRGMMLSCVLLEIEKPVSSSMVASDGKRMAVMSCPAVAASSAETIQPLIPPRAIALVQKILAEHDPEEEVSVVIEENEIQFRTTKVVIWSRLKEGNYPNYRKVFPAESKLLVSVLVREFVGALRQAKILTDKNNNSVSFTFHRDELVLESKATELGQSVVRLPISYDGKEITVTFNPDFLLDALKVLDGDSEVSIYMADPTLPLVLRTQDGFSYLAMPLNLNT